MLSLRQEAVVRTKMSHSRFRVLSRFNLDGIHLPVLLGCGNTHKAWLLLRIKSLRDGDQREVAVEEEEEEEAVFGQCRSCRDGALSTNPT